MMTEFPGWCKVGQKVTPVGGRPYVNLSQVPPPKMGEVYTIVDWSKISIFPGDARLYVKLEELGDIAVQLDSLRPVYPTNIEDLKKLDTPILEDA